MKLTRRDALKQFAIVSAGVFLIPSCVQKDNSKASVILKNLQISGSDEKQLAELAETIIPTTSTPGAKAISAHLFVLKMVDDCYNKENRERYTKGFNEFKKIVRDKHGDDFTASTPEQRNEFLADLESRKEDKPGDLTYFYRTTKQLTIQAYTTSQFYLTNVVVYELVPGRYHGCVPVKAGQ